ncbi:MULTISPECIES: acyl-CoA ligase (AMP-forming), exosortase A system-associated [unclassified Janthinobacterium]|uniref:acyl-CoA ligase (AMP-forming), exosortase A system-associated n=1 Tax=unclassified Janthinobacterium TaxID=2610881 RepID=UPI001608DDDB|nr:MULTISPECIES: acyl-CoA ligase (AMP-forming), exosortase A system-associated [unclassified Janthinobacterium]MBB5606527.1 acyl-CoA ligase (AMP-forming) (exosortase A-associated) [Janthinobacterium sp. S3T4]MBB5611601.1 acyl-CoA ligase (AMP-forming) (exosortase A-associated) [Janthinobacterium sp. S3M3]
MATLLHDFIFETAQRAPGTPALSYPAAYPSQEKLLSYTELARRVRDCASALLSLGLRRAERVAVYLEKCPENVTAMFGAAAAGGVFVPVNPLLKPQQLAYILADCNVSILVTSRERLAQLAPALAACPDLRTIIVTGHDELPASALPIMAWKSLLAAGADIPMAPHVVIDTDMAAILYTSGSTGRPKGVVLSHRNMVSGALSVASYLRNTPEDRILCVLPLSFDYGLSQLTTAFASGACAVLMNYLLLRDIIETVEQEAITGLAAVPPLWIQLSQLSWPLSSPLRYITNSGGAMQRSTIEHLRLSLPRTQIFLMYGLTEAFRSTYLAPEQLERRPDSIGQAIPNAEVLVLRPDGSVCEADEPGELVHRGALVALGYWNDAARTAERFKPLPAQTAGLVVPELAVWSGDTVRRDADGYLYFVGRNDDMIKTSGYRVSPAEVEEVVYASGLVGEAAALGVPHPVLGAAIALLVTAAPGVELSRDALLAACRLRLPAYMVPVYIVIRGDCLPRNPNGKIDRPLLAAELAAAHGDHT